eukprot:GHRR01013524.1.p2 GENE.GHRR01013524.1~~GHRR01013524.1.p2  ORF type:complete len:138 (+),score=53.24 GHRR01013524.1:1314-1727(+)
MQFGGALLPKQPSQALQLQDFHQPALRLNLHHQPNAVLSCHCLALLQQKFKSMQSMAPELTKAQMKLPAARRAKWLGCAVGMAMGCLLGLTPLLFVQQEQHDVAHHEHMGSHVAAQTAATPVAAPRAAPATAAATAG